MTAAIKIKDLAKKVMDDYNAAMANPSTEYERGFVDGAQHQMKSSVDKAVNAMAQREWVSLTDEELLKTYGWQFESYGQSDRPSSLGQSIVDEAKQEIIDGLRKVEAKLKEKNDRN